MNSAQEIIGIATTLVGAAGAGFAVAYSWMQKRINEATKALKAEVEIDIKELRERVAVLEHGQAEAREAILQAYRLAVRDSRDDIAERLLAAERALR